MTSITGENGLQYAALAYAPTAGLVTSSEFAGGAGKVTIVNDTAIGVRNVAVLTGIARAAVSLLRPDSGDLRR